MAKTRARTRISWLQQVLRFLGRDQTDKTNNARSRDEEGEEEEIRVNGRKQVMELHDTTSILRAERLHQTTFVYPKRRASEGVNRGLYLPPKLVVLTLEDN